MVKDLVAFIQNMYATDDFIPLHAPQFKGNEKSYLQDTIDSTFVSSVGAYVDQFEEVMQRYTGTKRAVAVVNGTAALHTALYMADVRPGDLVITQALTFVATCNALFHMGAMPIFVDVSMQTLGMCPIALEKYLDEHADVTDEGVCIHKQNGKKIKAVVPMHTFGHPVELDEILMICKKWKLTLVEDAAESLGSFYKGRHTGTIGPFGALSFNGNKIITTGGGGMVLCDDPDEGRKTKHVTTTAKVPHPYEFYHDQPGFNYRMPNLNAALGCAQLEMLDVYLESKHKIAGQYEEFFAGSDYKFVKEPSYAQSNYWLNAVMCPDESSREVLIKESNNQSVMTRPIWKLMHRLPMYKHALRGELSVSEIIEARLVNLPSSPIVMQPGK